MKNFLYIKSLDQAFNLLDQFKNDQYLYLDTEVSLEDINNFNPSKDKIRLIQLGNENITALLDIFYLEDEENFDKFKKALKDLLENKGIIGHNLKFDIKHIYAHLGIFPQIVFDTMIASQLLANGKKERFGLSAVVYKYLKKTVDKSQQASDWGLKILTEEQLQYAADDINILRELFPVIRNKINSMSKGRQSSGKISKIFGINNPVFAVEMAIVPILAKMEIDGVPIDTNRLNSLLNEIKRDIQKIFIDFKVKHGVDLDTKHKLADFIVNKLKIPLPKDRGSYSLKESVLRKFEDVEEIKKILDYMEKKYIFTKLGELNKHLKGNRIYPEFKQLASPTGRIYTHHPNIQNLPTVVEDIISSEERAILKADYSQIELRIVAEYVKEEKMIKAFQNNLDLHKYTASLIFKKDYNDINDRERKIAKSINFGLIYGMSPKTLKEQMEASGIEISLEEAKKFFDEFFKAYPQFAKWHESIFNKILKNKQMFVYSLLGRRMKVDRFTDAINYPIQGTGSDIFKMAIALIFKEIQEKGLDCKIINLVHDEIVVEVSKEDLEECKKLILENMKRAGKFLLKNVPVEVEVK